MGATSGGLRYPDNTGRVTDGALAIQQLAEDVQAGLLDKVNLGAWSAWTPIVSGTGWSLGNGTAFGRFTKIGKLVAYSAAVAFGSTSTFGAGGLSLNLPTARQTAGIGRDQHSGHVVHAGSSWIMTPVVTGTNTVAVLFIAGTPQVSQVTATQPFTWVSGDQLFLSGVFEST